MKCAFCGYKFEEDEGLSACRGCPIKGSCRMLRCPNCGYETPAEPGLIRLLRRWRNRTPPRRRANSSASRC
ncbi:MAG: hypothetical protein ACUVXI_04655 [bacterium]